MRMSDTFAYQHAPKSWKVRLIHAYGFALYCLYFGGYNLGTPIRPIMPRMIKIRKVLI